MTQQQVQKQKTATKTEEPQDVEAKDVKNEELDEEVEAMLDEIDDLLEHNAEEFVKGYVQKGGQ